MEVIIFIAFASFVCGGMFSAGYLLVEFGVKKLMRRMGWNP